MGSNPFWPTYLATINVLCVPTANVSAQHFAELFGTLSTIQQIRTAESNHENAAANDLIGASGYNRGSILFNYNASTGPADIDRFPFEWNALPLVILGVYFPTPAETATGSANGAGRHEQIALQDALRDLAAAFKGSQNGSICKLLVVGGLPEYEHDNVLAATAMEREVLKKVMHTVSDSLLTSIRQLPTYLSDLSFRNPQVTSHFRPAVDKSEDSATAGSNEERPHPEGSHASHSSMPSSVVSICYSPLSTEYAKLTSQQPGDNHKGRYTIVIGLLNLYVGAWPDAMRRLDEGATLARDAGDDLWQARALEALLLCMALLAWRGEAFNVPEVCLKAHSTSQMLSRSSTYLIQAEINNALVNTSGSELSPARKWAKYAPAVARATSNLYSALVDSSHVEVPTTIITESRIRLGNLLLFAHTHDNRLDTAAFESLILDQRIHSTDPHVRESMPTDPSLAKMMLDALSAPTDAVSEAHILTALAAVINSLSQLGSGRRHAFLFRSLLQRLIPILIRARKLGASEAGVHPSMAMSSLVSDVFTPSHRVGGELRTLLDSAASAYDLHVLPAASNDAAPTSFNERLRDSLFRWQLNQSRGDLTLKLEVLLLCVSVSDALPDMRTYLQYCSWALRTGLRTLTISMLSTNARPELPASEQARLVEGMKRSVLAAEKAGIPGLRADYWDDFLVRDAHLYQPPDAARLTSHKPSELSLLEDAKGDTSLDPFIFNPFAKVSSTDTIPVAVAGELLAFTVLLQNPLETEIEVDDISLMTEGCDFAPSHHSVVLGPFWSQAFSLTGIPRRKGNMKVLGCKAIIAGCREQDFPILPHDWRPSLVLKQKAVSKATVGEADMLAHVQVPTSKILTVKVINPQPQMVVRSSSLSQNSLMLLEGETKCFELTISNESQRVPTDLLLFTYQDNVSNELQEALGKKDLLPTDVYEIQHQLTKQPTIKMRREASVEAEAPKLPNASTKFRFDMYGRPGLVNAAVQMDFAYLGVPRSEITETFYTRQQRFPVAVTVNGSVDILRCNVLPLHGGVRGFSDDITVGQGGAARKDDFCMLTLDLRNVWPRTLSVELSSSLELSEISSTHGEGNQYTVHEELQPGHVSRVILLVPRLFIQDPYAPVPNLISQRQFVVSASKLTLEAEAVSREAFWYREELLKHINGSWKEPLSGRHGRIDLRKGIRLNSRTIDALKKDHVDISFSINSDKASETQSSVGVLTKSSFQIHTEAFVTFLVKVHNRSRDRLALLLRIQPSLQDQPHNIALDLSRRLAWSGVLQQALHPPLESGEIREARLDLVVFCEGNYEINATVEEIKGRRKTSLPPVMDALGVTADRRIWHARTPCVIKAVDNPS